MKKITFVITGLGTGGAEMMLYKLLQHMDRCRFAPTVISLSTHGEIGPRIEALGVPVHALGLRSNRPDPLKFLSLVCLLRRIRPDLVQTWMYHADFLGGLAARLAGCGQVVWGLRNSDLAQDGSARLTSWVMRTCARLSSWLPLRIVSCSARARDIHVAAGYRADRFLVIPNGFDLTRFGPDSEARLSVRSELGWPAHAPLIGLIGRDDPQKNHAGFFLAAKQVLAQLPTARFVLAGTDVDEDNAVLQAVIDGHGLTGCVRLLGRRDDVPRLMAALDVLVSSSHGEAFPNVLGEAMACGVPCAVTDVGDSALIVGDTGRVVAAGDMPGLAGAIMALLRLPAEEKATLGQRARTRVEEHYDIGHVVRLYENLYEQLLVNATEDTAACAD